jgi:uncharacterized protein YndB with AHSA1/START domain
MNGPAKSAKLAQTGQAEGTKSAFHYSVETSARPETLWRLWTDVANWPAWDTELESARLEGAFQAGARGALKGKGNPRSTFVIESVESERSYRFVTALPFGGRLLIERRLTPLTQGTRFRHDVRFEGFGGAVLSLLFGGRYRAALPVVMERIKSMAESNEARR